MPLWSIFCARIAIAAQLRGGTCWWHSCDSSRGAINLGGNGGRAPGSRFQVVSRGNRGIFCGWLWLMVVMVHCRSMLTNHPRSWRANRSLAISGVYWELNLPLIVMSTAFLLVVNNGLRVVKDGGKNYNQQEATSSDTTGGQRWWCTTATGGTSEINGALVVSGPGPTTCHHFRCICQNGALAVLGRQWPWPWRGASGLLSRGCCGTISVSVGSARHGFTWSRLFLTFFFILIAMLAVVFVIKQETDAHPTD